MVNADDSVKTAVQAEILSEKALRYKRAAMVLALVTAAIHFFPFVDFSGLSLAGVQLKQDAPSRRLLVLVILWLILIYNAMWAVYLCWRDWRGWRANVVDRWPGEDFFPELRMFWSKLPSSSLAARKYTSDLDEFVSWVGPLPDKHSRVWEYLAELKNKNGTLRKVAGFRLPLSVIKNVREKFSAFMVEAGIGVLCCLFALGGLFWEIVRLWR